MGMSDSKAIVRRYLDEVVSGDRIGLTDALIASANTGRSSRSCCPNWS